MLNPKINVCKLRNGVLLNQFACFQDGRQNHTESYIVVDLLFNVPLMGRSAVLILVFPVYTHLLFAYLVSSYCNECFIHSTILN